MDGVRLLAEARANGLRVRADGDRLVIRGPRRAEAVAKRLLERKREVLAALEGAGGTDELRDTAAVRIYSHILDAALWIATDETAAAELHREGVQLPVLLPDEALILGRMAESTARDVFAALARVQRVMPGSRLRSVEALDA
jgi:hypothetical protein